MGNVKESRAKAPDDGITNERINQRTKKQESKQLHQIELLSAASQIETENTLQ